MIIVIILHLGSWSRNGHATSVSECELFASSRKLSENAFSFVREWERSLLSRELLPGVNIAALKFLRS